MEKHYESRGTYTINSQIKFKTTLLKSRLCDYSDANILVKRNVTIANIVATGATSNNNDKKVTSKNCAPFNDNQCKSR